MNKQLRLIALDTEDLLHRLGAAVVHSAPDVEQAQQFLGPVDEMDSQIG